MPPQYKMPSEISFRRHMLSAFTLFSKTQRGGHYHFCPST
ncbi:hypothetical protein NMH_1935 [Neisseria meningitidis H44/76]|uniref:Uncharacterized protein n=3 Tax=Neisseria meningitidis TaxID=487 RepID=E6MYT6_NEIMH|nr:hypothetical protein NEIPOLOT_01055 [Neisseria polysaccharea ATCC 43768]EFV63338.1 hypothetical protein NMH_1935 [Neisseria meningitidis H44/76]KER40609.1 hypothetical protein F528_0418 [Neisseria meningitidis 992008]CBA05306.1 hypothetical protein predicted by Glimmer/Critica [Neisseria meningitidis alpha153]CCA43928.1 hypothetical protein NMALPHA522_0387 [Neisseria meningitidis alpha522]